MPLLATTLWAWGLATEFIRREWIVACVWNVTLAFCLGSLIHAYHPLCKSGDWVRVTQFLESHEDANQPIIVFTNEVDTILRNYYRGKNSVVPVPSPQRMDRFLYADFDIPSEQFVRELLDPILQDAHEIWLVTYDSGINDSPNQYHREYLDDYLSENFSLTEHAAFFESSVRRLTRRTMEKP